VQFFKHLTSSRQKEAPVESKGSLQFGGTTRQSLLWLKQSTSEFVSEKIILDPGCPWTRQPPDVKDLNNTKAHHAREINK